MTDTVPRISARLKHLKEHMRRTATAMDREASTPESVLIFHAGELRAAAELIDTWIDGLREEIEV